MFILEEPYVSTLLADTVEATGLPVLDTPKARVALAGRAVALFSDEEFAQQVRARGGRGVYANSENAIGWVAEHLGDTPLPGHVDLFKDKVRFRELVADLFPGYRFCGLRVSELRDFDVASFPAPFVVKPAVGFFSMGVHVVGDASEWPGVVDEIEREVSSFAAIYPEAVLGLERFVIEQVIEGEEFAVDAYFDDAGEPVLINVYTHLFASADDVSDRVYYTSVETVERLGGPALEFLREVGRRAELRGFPMHAELRIDADGAVAPIEINPLRFGGWCATDLAHFAYGVNPYRCYLDRTAPDWEAIAAERGSAVNAMIVCDLPAHVDLARIESVDYERFSERFSDLLELRPTDFSRYPVFAFAFARVPADDLSELHALLGEDLSGYLEMRS